MSAPTFNGISAAVLRPKLACIGMIKLGGKAPKQKSAKGVEFQRPEKYDHFRIRTRERDASGNYILDKAVHDKIGMTPKELNVRFLWDDVEQNFRTALQAWDGGKLRCEGNGERAFDRVLNKEILCTCPLLKQHKGDYPLTTYPRPVGSLSCKPYGVLSVFLEEAAVYGGYHILRTTSWETISSLTAAMRLFKEQFGILSWIPFKLLAYPHTVSYQENGKEHTSNAYGVTLVLRGTMETAYQIAAAAKDTRAHALQLNPGTPEEHEQQIAAIEVQDAPDIAGEFHPGQQAEGEPGPDFEVVTDDEETDTDRALELRIRRALELAQRPPDRINRAIAEYSDRLGELALEVEAKRPAEWKQAGEELAAPAEPAPIGSGAEPLNLFGDV